jgi:hypothetical protein
MKKFVFGCLGVLVLAAIAGGVAAYFVFQRAKTTLLTYSARVTQLQEIPRIEAQVRNKAEFTAPATGELTEDQVARLVAVQQTIKDRLGARVKELDAKYEALSKAHGGNSSISDGLEALKDLGSLVLDAKKVQVDALNAQRFSLAEYDWTRKSAYRAAGVPLSAGFDEIVRKVQGGTARTSEVVTAGLVANVPEKNKQLVGPHAEALRQNAGLAFFGL